MLRSATSCFIMEEDCENGSFSGDNRHGNLSLRDENMEPASAMDGTLSATLLDKPKPSIPKEYTTKETLLLAYQSIGVVYGDLATSPVNVFSATTLTNLDEEDLLGTFSLIFWTLTIIVLIKYGFIVLQANDRGEGGTFALYSHLSQHIHLGNRFIIRRAKLGCSDVKYYDPANTCPLGLKMKKLLETETKAQDFLVFIVLIGTCMVIGDGALTPATCVLSAIQGIQSCSSNITQGHVVIISLALLVMVFLLQSYGTSKVSFIFSPIMLLWLITNTCIGVYNICKYDPSILKAVSPHYIVLFLSKDAKASWTVLGAVFLSITGAEAMFADLGHFNKKAIQWSFSFLVYPSLIFSYAGETAYLINHPENISNAYYSSVPGPVYWPMFVISTLAAIVASQSMISASFSIVKQSMALGCFPPVTMICTSSKHQGQVYSPEVNYALMIICIGLVIGFQGGTALANAYGVVVIWVMIITTLLTTLVMLVVWQTNTLLSLWFFVPYMLIEGILMTSLLNKIPQGGWVPFATSAILGTIMLSWTYGNGKKSKHETQGRVSLMELQMMISNAKLYRTPGICFFLTDIVDGIPPMIRHYIHHTNSIHEIMVIVTIRTLPIQTVPLDKRFNVNSLGPGGVYSCLVELGCKDSLNMEEGSGHITRILAKVGGGGADTNVHEQRIRSLAAEKEAVFVVGRTILRAKQDGGWLARFAIDHVYRFLESNCKLSLSNVQIPADKALQIGIVHEI